MTTAVAAYQQGQANVTVLMDRLAAAISQHADKAASKPLDWGFVGDIAGMEGALEELVDRLGG